MEGPTEMRALLVARRPAQCVRIERRKTQDEKENTYFPDSRDSGPPLYMSTACVTVASAHSQRELRPWAAPRLDDGLRLRIGETVDEKRKGGRDPFGGRMLASRLSEMRSSRW